MIVTLFAEGVSNLPDVVAGTGIATMILGVVVYFLKRSDDREEKQANKADAKMDEILRDLAACHAREAVSQAERAALAARIAVLEARN